MLILRIRLVLVLCLLPIPAIAARMPPVFDGYITNFVSINEFDVGARHVTCNSKTQWVHVEGLPDFVFQLRVGALVHVEGEMQHGVFVATTVAPVRGIESSLGRDLEGKALIELPPQLHREGSGWAGVLWVDGLPLQVTPATKLIGAALDRDQNIMTGEWATYKARRGEDAAIIADSITFRPNQVDQDEVEYRKKLEPEYTAPDPVTHEGGTLKFGKHLPAKFDLLANQEMQDYVSKIGNSLVPPYQKALATDDPARIDFRFYVIHFGSKWKIRMADCEAFGNGVILVPDNVVSSLENEAQLAARLSNCIAGVIEKDGYLHRTRVKTEQDIDLVSSLAGIYGLPVSIPNAVALAKLLNDLNERDDRIGLGYMLQQGYDIREAAFAGSIAANQEIRNPLKPGEPAPSRAASLMNTLRLDYGSTDYSGLRTNRDAYTAIRAKLVAGDDKLPKPKNRGL